MSNEQLSIRPLFRELDALNERIRTANVEPSAEFKRTRALKVLAGVRETLEAFCLASTEQQSFYEFEIGRPR